MSLFFKKTIKKQLHNGEVQIYTDLYAKQYQKLAGCEDEVTADHLLLQFRKSFYFGFQRDYSDVEAVYLLILVTEDPKKNKYQRRLNPEEKPIILLSTRKVGWQNYLLYQEMSTSRLIEMRSYHQNVMHKLNLFMGQSKDIFERRGTLMKKTKNGQFKSRTFKLMKDCLVYYKGDKQSEFVKMKYIALDTITIQPQQSTKEKYIFFLTSEQLLLTLKANSKTDYEGWLYSLQKQSNQMKETKLFLDYDKKVHIIQKQKLDYIKNSVNSTQNGLRHLMSQTNGGAEIIQEMIHRINLINPIDAKLIGLLSHIQSNQKVNQIQTKLLYEFVQMLKINPQESEFIQFIKSQRYSDFEKFNKLLEKIQEDLFQEDQNTLIKLIQSYSVTYLEKKYYEIYKNESWLKQTCIMIPVKRFNQYYRFALPNFHLFWNDIYEEQQIQI